MAFTGPIMLSCQCKTRNGSGVAHKLQRFGISQQKKHLIFLIYDVSRPLLFPTPVNPL